MYPPPPFLLVHLKTKHYLFFPLTSDRKSTSRSFQSPDSKALPVLPGLSAVQDLDEGFAKLDVERGVDDGVDGAVEVSQPGDSAVQRGRDAAAPAVGLQHVGEEERQPADDEHALEPETGSV